MLKKKLFPIYHMIIQRAQFSFQQINTERFREHHINYLFIEEYTKKNYHSCPYSIIGWKHTETKMNYDGHISLLFQQMKIIFSNKINKHNIFWLKGTDQMINKECNYYIDPKINMELIKKPCLFFTADKGVSRRLLIIQCKKMLLFSLMFK